MQADSLACDPPGSDFKADFYLFFKSSLMSLLKCPFKSEKPLFLQSVINSECQNLYKSVVWGPVRNPASAPGQFSSVQLLSCVRLFATPWTAARQASLSITSSQSLLKLMSIELVPGQCLPANRHPEEQRSLCRWAPSSEMLFTNH